MRDALSYWLASRDAFEYWFLTINKKLWDGLSKEDKAILSAAADKVMDEQALAAEKDETEFKKKLEAAGVKVYEVTPARVGNECKSSPRKSLAQDRIRSSGFRSHGKSESTRDKDIQIAGPVGFKGYFLIGAHGEAGRCSPASHRKRGNEHDMGQI